MGAGEAKAYGLIDEVLVQKKSTPRDDRKREL
jgi:ATP-dependent protease ClpP protease subunit